MQVMSLCKKLTNTHKSNLMNYQQKLIQVDVHRNQRSSLFSKWLDYGTYLYYVGMLYL